MSLLDVIPQPRPVRLAGRTFLCRERDLGCLVYFESLALAARGDEPPLWARTDLEPADRRRRMRRAFDTAERGESLPSWGSAEVSAVLLGTAIGRQEYLRRVLVQDLTVEELVELDGLMGPDDWGVLLDATGPDDSIGKADRAILEEVGVLTFFHAAKSAHVPDDPDEAPGFRGALAAICKTTGLQPAALATWTISEIVFFVNEGRLPRVDHSCPPGSTRKTWDEKIMAPIEAFWAEDEAT